MHPWAEKYGIDDCEAMERIKWGVQMFKGTILSVTKIKKSAKSKFPELDTNTEVMICIVPNTKCG